METAPCPWRDGVLLVCINERAPGAPKPSCGRDRGAALRKLLKQRARAAGVDGLRVLEASCLDVCPARGVAVARVPGDEVAIVDPRDDSDIEAVIAWARGAPR